MKTVPLDKVANVDYGYAFDSKRFGDEGDLPLVRIRDVVRGKSNTYYTGEFDARHIVNNGDLLVGMDGEFNRERWAGGKALLNQRVCRIKAVDPSLDESYLYWFLPEALKEIERQTPFVTVKHLSAKEIKAIALPLPPIEEQRRIASILDAADALRTKRRQALAKLDTLTQAIFVDMFGWMASDPSLCSPLAELVDPEDRINYGVVQPGSDVIEGVPMIRVGDLIDGRINHDSVKRITADIDALYSRSRLVGDEILLSCVGSAGVVALASPKEKGWNIARAVARIPLQKSIEREYVAAFLSGPIAQRYFDNELRTVSQPTLNIKQIKETLVPIPTTRDQASFVMRVQRVRQAQEFQRTSLEHLDALFVSLQHRAFRGEL